MAGKAIQLYLWGVDMLFKYYSYNFVDSDGLLRGAYAAKAWFWINPLKVMDAAMKIKPRSDVFIVDFKRIS